MKLFNKPKRRASRSARVSKSNTKRKRKAPNYPLYALIVVLVLLTYLVIVKIGAFDAVRITNVVNTTASQRLLIDREGVSTTLYVFQSPMDKKLIGGWIVISNEKTGSNMVYYIPLGVSMRDYSGQFDEYVPVSNLRYAGNVLSQSRDIEYAIWQLSSLSGISIDSYIWLDERAVSSFSSYFGDIFEYSQAEYKDNYTNSTDIVSSAYILNSFLEKAHISKIVWGHNRWEQISTGVYTNLSPTELLLKLRKHNLLINGKGNIMFSLAKSNFTTPVTTSSGAQVSIVNYGEVDKEFNTYLSIVRGREIEREQARVEVYNGSGISGLASRYARKIQNSGITVVRYENAPDSEQITKIYIPKSDKYPNSLALVKKLLVVEGDIIEDRPSFITTGDIVIILGEDIEKEVNYR